jgi:hypothetical protein
MRAGLATTFEMPRYSFDVLRNERQFHRDEVGTDLADDRAAWKEAMRCVREIEDVLAPGGQWRLTVRRDVRIVFRIEIKTTAWLGQCEL